MLARVFHEHAYDCSKSCGVCTIHRIDFIQKECSAHFLFFNAIQCNCLSEVTKSILHGKLSSIRFLGMRPHD